MSINTLNSLSQTGESAVELMSSALGALRQQFGCGLKRVVLAGAVMTTAACKGAEDLPSMPEVEIQSSDSDQDDDGIPDDEDTDDDDDGIPDDEDTDDDDDEDHGNVTQRTLTFEVGSVLTADSDGDGINDTRLVSDAPASPDELCRNAGYKEASYARGYWWPIDGGVIPCPSGLTSDYSCDYSNSKDSQGVTYTINQYYNTRIDEYAPWLDDGYELALDEQLTPSIDPDEEVWTTNVSDYMYAPGWRVTADCEK